MSFVIKQLTILVAAAIVISGSISTLYADENDASTSRELPDFESQTHEGASDSDLTQDDDDGFFDLAANLGDEYSYEGKIWQCALEEGEPAWELQSEAGDMFYRIRKWFAIPALGMETCGGVLIPNGDPYLNASCQSVRHQQETRLFHDAFIADRAQHDPEFWNEAQDWCDENQDAENYPYVNGVTDPYVKAIRNSPSGDNYYYCGMTLTSYEGMDCEDRADSVMSMPNCYEPEGGWDEWCSNRDRTRLEELIDMGCELEGAEEEAAESCMLL